MQTINSVLCDTGFFIRLLKQSDPLHEHAKGYFKYFLQKDISLKCSTISIAEYCVKGSASELPLRNLQVLPFNFDHAERAGRLTAAYRSTRNMGDPPGRIVVINDVKLLAQADVEETIEGYATFDSNSKGIYDALSKTKPLLFQFIDMHIPYHEMFGILPL